MKRLTFLAATEYELQEEAKKEATEWANTAASGIETQHQRLLQMINLTSISAYERARIEQCLAAIAKQTREALQATVTISADLRSRFFCLPNLN